MSQEHFEEISSTFAMKHPLWLKDELIRFWRSKVTGTSHQMNLMNVNLARTIFQECVEEFLSNLATTYTWTWGRTDLILEVKGHCNHFLRVVFLLLNCDMLPGYNQIYGHLKGYIFMRSQSLKKCILRDKLVLYLLCCQKFFHSVSMFRDFVI